MIRATVISGITHTMKWGRCILPLVTLLSKVPSGDPRLSLGTFFKSVKKDVCAQENVLYLGLSGVLPNPFLKQMRTEIKIAGRISF